MNLGGMGASGIDNVQQQIASSAHDGNSGYAGASGSGSGSGQAGGYAQGGPAANAGLISQMANI